MNRDTIRKTLSELIGKRVEYIIRSMDLIEIGFGGINNIIKGIDKRSAEYSLHVQTSFRITTNRDVLLGYSDLFVFPEADINKNYFDDKTAFFYKKAHKAETIMGQSIVEKVSLNEFGDLIIVAGDVMVTIYNTTSSSKVENWRLLRPSHPELRHLVSYGKKICFE